MSYTADQLGNARAIMSVAAARGLGTDGQILGVMTALAESTLINVNHGDGPGPSSRGLFQQMPSWGPESVRMNPAGAAGLFFDRVVKVPGWLLLIKAQPWVLAQSVQQSEFSSGSNYQSQLPAARQVVQQVGPVTSGIPSASNVTANSPAVTSVKVPPYAIKGFNGKPDVILEDGIWKQYFSATGLLQGIGKFQTVYGRKVTQGGYTPGKQADGTYIDLTPADDLSHYVAAVHFYPNGGGRISTVLMAGEGSSPNNSGSTDSTAGQHSINSNSHLVGYISDAGLLNGSVSDGGGVVPEAGLGIPDAVASGAQALEDGLFGAIGKYLWIGAGGVLVLLGVVMLAKANT